MKKGFTLLELLSVIIIIAVITLIAVPVVSGIITKVRLNALKSSANGLLEASDLYYSEYINTKTIRFDIDDNNISSSDTTNLLSYKGEVKEGTVIINKKGETTLCITDGTNSVYKNYRDKKVVEAANQKCNIPSSTYIVYLDNTATLNEYSNEELTELVRSMQEEINTLKAEKASQTDLETITTVVNSKANQSDLDTTNSNLEIVSTVASGAATLNAVYPVGSIYISINSTSPATLFGGTWERIQDKFLLSAGSTYAAGSTGGTATINLQHSHSMQNHTHTLSHTHTLANGYAKIDLSINQTVRLNYTSGKSWTANWGASVPITGQSGPWTIGDGVTLGGTTDGASTSTTSGPSTANTDSKLSTAQSIMPPYLSVYIWKRTA